MRFIACILGATGFALAPTAVNAQSISGEIGVFNQYLDDDLLPLTDKPVVQAGIYIDVSKNCSLDVWGSHGINTSQGGELDVGGSCRFTAGETEVEVSANRLFLRGLSDITALSISATRGPVKVEVEQYLWDNNPDATRVTAGYNIDVTEKFSLRPSLVYQTGFGERDVFGGGASASYAITKNLSIVGTLLTPFSGDRSTQGSVGLNFTF